LTLSPALGSLNSLVSSNFSKSGWFLNRVTSLADNLSKLRQTAALSREALAKKAQVSQATIARIEAGQVRDPKISVLVRLAKAMGISVPALLDGELTPASTQENLVAQRIVGDSAAIKNCLRYALTFSQNEGPLLIAGETGTGKNLFARYIHEQSARKTCPLIWINCAALAPELAAAELFGYAHGAFTGAAHGGRAGAFERAKSGTIFLDEIRDMPLDLQPLLLRVIEDKTVQPLGSGRQIDIGCRIIAATNEGLNKLAEDGRFRADLYFRFVNHLDLPPLREHPSDIPLLVEYFTSLDAKRLNIAPKTLTEEALGLLCSYCWPGNVRQLESVLNVLMLLTQGEVIGHKEVKQILGQYGFQLHLAGRAPELFTSGRIPYYFGPPVSDASRFYGRKYEMQELLRLVRQAEHGNFWSIAIIGDHRLGKSSLLRVLDAEIPSRTHSMSTYIDLASVGQNEFFETIIRSIAELAYSDNNTVLKRIKEAFDTGSWKSVLGEVDVDIMGFLKIKKNVESQQDWKAFRAVLGRLRTRFPEGVSSVVLIIDEISTCVNWEKSGDILRNWRSLIQGLQGYNFIVADARPLYEISKEKFSPFFNVFMTVPLGALSSEEAGELIVQPGASVGLAFTPDAIALIKDLSACKPYYIQVICCSICEWLAKFKSNPVVSVTVVEVCTEAALRRLGEHFSAMWSTLTDFQRRFALDILNGRPLTLASMEDASEFEREHRELKLLRDRQVLSMDSSGQSKIEPLLARWLRQYYSQEPAS
jgi:transcriptional regulator with AAA-type ATPase domain